MLIFGFKLPIFSKRYQLVIVLFFILIQNVGAQDIYEKYNIYRNPIRVFLNKFSITATTGYGSTTYSHDLKGVYFFQDANNQFIFSNGEGINNAARGYTDWLNDPRLSNPVSVANRFDVPFDPISNPVNNPALGPNQFILNTDTSSLGFEGGSWGIPFLLSIHYDYEKFRIGVGFMYEKQFVSELTPTAFADRVRKYKPNFTSTSYTRFFGILGYQFYQFWDYDFVAELQVGKISAGSEFSTSAVTRGVYANIGVSIENNWSEYFRVVVRPSMDLKNYTVTLPDGATVTHNQPSFFLQVGLSINIPDIPRSPMKSDHVQLKHVYTDPKTGRLMEVRGQPIWKKQNPKVGQNHRRLWRYKRKNRRKLNPY